MSYNGSGTFVINTSGQPVVAGTVISSTAFNALTADLATGLSTAITKDGQTTTTARIPFAQGISSTLTTDSSSVSTGSIITAGGMGIAKALYVGTTANVASTTDSSSISTGSIVTAGGVGIAKNLYVGVNANIAGTLGVTGVATFSAAPIYSSLTASSAVATDASKALVSVTNTGTGNNVLATSPTLVTPVLGAASATSVTVAAGTVSDPAITTAGDTNTGIFFPAADTIAFAEGGVEAMRITSAGDLLVGTTSNAVNNSNSFAYRPDIGAEILNHINGTASGSQYIYFGYNGSVVGSVTQNGTTGVLYNLTSDYRLKNEQQPLTGAKDFIMALKPKKWQWWDGSGEGVGFVAHEFMEVAKYSGQGEKDAVDENGKPKYQSIQPSSSEVMANMVSLMQEQQALITAQQASLDSLTARITALEAK